MRLERAPLCAIAIALIGLSLSTEVRAADCCYKLKFPNFVRKESSSGSGRVSKLKVTVQCGHITGVSNIPRGWSVEVLRLSAGTASIRAAAEHGATYLWDMKAWDGSILIMPTDAGCFDVSAEIVTDGRRKIRTQSLDFLESSSRC